MSTYEPHHTDINGGEDACRCPYCGAIDCRRDHDQPREETDDDDEE